MNNIDFLARMLKHNEYYWVVAKRKTARVMMEDKRIEDNILLICLDDKFVGLSDEEITYGKLREFLSYQPPNLYLCESYTPFQQGISMYDIYDGASIPNGLVNPFIKEALTMDSRDIHSYKSLIKLIQDKNEQD